jgi:hypothetical protein
VANAGILSVVNEILEEAGRLFLFNKELFEETGRFLSTPRRSMRLDGRPLLLRSYRARRRGADRRLWEANTGKGRGRGRR